MHKSICSLNRLGLYFEICSIVVVDGGMAFDVMSALSALRRLLAVQGLDSGIHEFVHWCWFWLDVLSVVACLHIATFIVLC